jgi:hypothetical protein
MKRITLLLPILLGAGLLMLGSGCRTPGSGDSTTDTKPTARIHGIAKLAAYVGTRAQLLRDPSSRPALEQVRGGVNDLVAQSQWDTTALVLVAGGHFPEMQSDEGTLILTATPLLIDLLTGARWDLRDSEYAEATITGIAEGMNLALGPAVVVTRGGPPPLPTPLPPAHGVIEKLQADARATR